MTTTAAPERVNWLSAEVDLADARIAAIQTAMLHLDAVAGFLATLERQQATAMLDTLALRRRAEETVRDQHDAELRKVSNGAA
jgi:hypothetical protein